MRVLLINPKFRLPIDTRTTPHLGLAYLAAMSERRGDEVVIFDADVEDEPVTEFVQRFRPHLVGITTNTPQIFQAWRTAKAIKEVHDVPIVLGGPHVSVVAENLDFESIEKPYVDMVVRGEGEETWVEISDKLEEFLKDRPTFSTEALMDPALDIWKDVEGLSYKTTDGELHRNPDRAPVADLDSLPWPAYHLFKMDRYTNLQPATDHLDGSRSFSMLTSRGCPYRCAFCSQSVMPIKWRARSPENVIEEWRHYVEDLDAVEIGILDDTANVRKDRLHKICDLLIANNLNHVPWIFVNGIRANIVDEPLLRHLKAAGLKRTAYGVETGDEAMLKRIQKREDKETIKRAFELTKKVGIETIGFFIIGLPGDTEETMQRTIDFAIELDPLIANFSMMTPYPGTLVYQIVKKEGRFLMKDWEDSVFFDTRARYEIWDTTAEIQEKMYRKAYRQFYWRPKYILRRIKDLDFWLNIGRNARIAYRTVFPRVEKEELKRQMTESSI